MTNPPTQTIESILANIEGWHGYREEAIANLPEDVRPFVDDASWAGELLKAERLRLAAADVSLLITKAELVGLNKIADIYNAEPYLNKARENVAVALFERIRHLTATTQNPTPLEQEETK